MGSEMCIRDRLQEQSKQREKETEKAEKREEGRWNRVLDMTVKPIIQMVLAALVSLVIYGQIKP